MQESGADLDLLQSSGEYLCTFCPTGVGNNSIYCNDCKLWEHKKCSGLQWLIPNPDYRCALCMGNTCPINGRPQSEVQVGPDKLEVVASFCYLGDMLSTGGGCEITVTTHVKPARKKFRELLPVLTSCHLSYKTRGHVYNSCMPVKLGHWPGRVCSTMIGPWSDRSAVSSHRCGHSNCQSLSLRSLTSFWEGEGFAGLGMWSVLVVQSEQHVINRLMAGEGQGGRS